MRKTTNFASLCSPTSLTLVTSSTHTEDSLNKGTCHLIRLHGRPSMLLDSSCMQPLNASCLGLGWPWAERPRSCSDSLYLSFLICGKKKKKAKNCMHLLSEKAMAPHSSTLAWKIPWMEEPGRLQSMESLRVGHDWVISLPLFTFMHWRRKWQPTPVFLPG